MLQIKDLMTEDSSLNIDTFSDISVDATVETDAEAESGAKVHQKQLVSESADESEDKKDDLKLQVPLTSRNDAVYMGTVFMGSPVS